MEILSTEQGEIAPLRGSPGGAPCLERKIAVDPEAIIHLDRTGLLRWKIQFGEWL
jgi:hypothetical protein